MIIPRTWGGAEKQASPDQTLQQAEPMATDSRFKAAAFLLFFAWCVIVFSLWHSIRWYKPRNRGIFNRLVGFFRYTPSKFMLVLPLTLMAIGFEAATAFDFTINPISINAKVGWIYGLGYGPLLLTLFVFEVYGFIDEYDDQVLLQQRRESGETIDQEVGIAKKPRWWDSFRRDFQTSEQRLRGIAADIDGGRATQRRIQRDFELQPATAAPINPLTDEARSCATMSSSPPAYTPCAETNSGRSDSTMGNSIRTPPVRVRSMLHV